MLTGDNVITWTHLLFRISLLIDGGHSDLFSPQEVQDEIDKGDVFELLYSKTNGAIDIDMFRQVWVDQLDDEQKRLFNPDLPKECRDMLRRYWLSPLDFRDYHIQNNGLCVLVTLMTEIIQQLTPLR